MRVALFALELIGPFRLRTPNGSRINIASRKSQALIAMLALSASGERTRSWLQSQLWGTRAADQAQASLRNELSTLRTMLNSDGGELLSSDKNTVRLNLSMIKVDARAGGGLAVDGLAPDRLALGELLEGIDIPGEDGFEEWLREERARAGQGAGAKSAAANFANATSAPLALAEFAALPALAILPFANLTGDAAQAITQGY